MNKVIDDQSNFQKLVVQSNEENESVILKIFNNETFNELFSKSHSLVQKIITEKCLKIFTEIKYSSYESNIINKYDIIYTPKKGEEKKTENLKNLWNKCVENIRNSELEKEQYLKNIMDINQTYFLDCIENCKLNKNQKNCIDNCWEFNKYNSIVSANLINDDFLKYLDKIKKL